VVMDDFFYGEPIAVPEASPATILLTSAWACGTPLLQAFAARA